MMTIKKNMIVSVQHPALTMLRIEINTVVIQPKVRANTSYFLARHNDNIEIFFEPWGIEPLVRFGYHLVNYGIAGINQWDHKLDFVMDESWPDLYFDQIIQNKKEYIRSSGNLDLNYDAYLGIDSFHWDIVEQIEKKI